MGPILPEHQQRGWEAASDTTAHTRDMERFADRIDAGRQLARRLEDYRATNLVVLGLPRGGVPVGYQVAHALGAPLDVLIVRKLGVPRQPELAFGAIGEGGVKLLNDLVMRYEQVSGDDVAAVEAVERPELERRAALYRNGRPALDLSGRSALIIDDGFATGATARVACMIARAQGAARVILAAAIGPRNAVAELAGFDAVIDDVVCLGTPAQFTSVGQGYVDFGQTSDSEVCDLLQRSRAAGPGSGTAARGQ